MRRLSSILLTIAVIGLPSTGQAQSVSETRLGLSQPSVGTRLLISRIGSPRPAEQSGNYAREGAIIGFVAGAGLVAVAFRGGAAALSFVALEAGLLGGLVGLLIGSFVPR